LYTALLILTGVCHFFYFLVNRVLLRGLNRLPTENTPLKSGSSDELRKVSVLISIRNEEKVVKACLDALLSQDYAREKYEVILVNDRSTDKTGQILDSYVTRNPELFKCITITQEETSASPKKYALSKGIKLCSGEIILSTDADCIFTEKWISCLVSNFDADTGMALGATTHYQQPDMNQFLWGIQALEFFSHTVVSASMIANNFPINANANNMAYSRKAFEQAGGFEVHRHITSGDDDFLTQKIAALKKWKIKFITHPDSAVMTSPCKTFREIWEQRKRWASKCSLYGKKQVAFLSGVYFYYFLILTLILSGLFVPAFLLPGLTSWALKTLMDYLAVRHGTNIFRQEKLLDWFIPAAILHIPLIVLAVFFGSFGHFTWKGQKVRKTA
jgi:cellulose synthase/poly-beta-1,6-N-acetylglucosamine synthase-like glycosyltransferase